MVAGKRPATSRKRRGARVTIVDSPGPRIAGITCINFCPPMLPVQAESRRLAGPRISSSSIDCAAIAGTARGCGDARIRRDPSECKA